MKVTLRSCISVLGGVLRLIIWLTEEADAYDYAVEEISTCMFQH